MRFLLFFSLIFPAYIFAETFEEVTAGWRCVHNVDFGVQGQFPVFANGDFCIYNQSRSNNILEWKTQEILMAVRMRGFSDGEIVAITKGSNGEDYVLSAAENYGCLVFSPNNSFLISYCVISNDAYRIAVQQNISEKLAKRAIWFSPEVTRINKSYKEVLTPVTGRSIRGFQKFIEAGKASSL